MKKILYSSLIISLLLVGCTEEKNETDLNPQKNISEEIKEEENILEEIKESGDVSVTGNDLNISDEEKNYKFRLRIIDIHNMFMSYMLYNIPNVQTSDEYYINKYAVEDAYYKQDGEVIKSVLTDTKYYDPKFNNEEQKLHESLTETVDLFGDFFEWTEKNNLFVEGKKDEDGSYFIFNKKEHDISSYENKVQNLNEYMSKQLLDYFTYSVHFLNETDKVYKEEELISYLNFESSLFNSKDFIEQEMNSILDRKSTKSKKEESWNNLKKEIELVKLTNKNEVNFINIHDEYFNLLNKISENSTYDKSLNDLTSLDEWYKTYDFLDNYTVENLFYIQTFIEYYKYLYFNEIN